MQSTIPLYGFGGGSGGTGAVLTVAAPVGATVTVSKDGKSKTKVADSDGSAVFQGLSTGDWLLSITDGTQTAQKTVTITADYATAITFFSAAIHVTYPAGATCTATDGVTTLTAPDTGGSWDCVVPNTGTWTVSAGDYYPATVEITSNGQTEDVDLTRLWIVKDGQPTTIGLSSQLILSRITVTQNSDYVNFVCVDGAVGGITSDEKVDLTAYTTVTADVNIVKQGTSDTTSSFNGVGLILADTTGTTSKDAGVAAVKHETLTKSKGQQTLSINAESITGSWYVGFAIGANANFNVYNLYAEV